MQIKAEKKGKIQCRDQGTSEADRCEIKSKLVFERGLQSGPISKIP